MPALEEHREAFDIYFCNDPKEAKKYFHLTQFPDVCPVAVIVDPLRREALDKPKDPAALI